MVGGGSQEQEDLSIYIQDEVVEDMERDEGESESDKV